MENTHKPRYVVLTSQIIFWTIFAFFSSGDVITAYSAPAHQLPIGVQAVLQKVSPYLKQKRYDEALEILTAFNARSKKQFDPEANDPRGYHHPEIYFTLGNCYLLQNQYNRAAEAYEKTLAKDKTHLGAWLNLAKVYYEQNKTIKAAHCFEQAYAATTEKNPEHLYLAACAYLMGEKFHHAIQLFNRLSNIHPKAMQPVWNENYIHALLAVDRPLQALPLIKLLAQVYTGEKKIRWQEILLSQYLALEQYENALTFACDLTRQSPTTARWWKAKAHVHLSLDEPEEALCALMIYRYLKPLSREEKKLLADLHLQAGIPAKAAPLYDSLMKEKPEKNTLKHLTMANQQTGNVKKALAQLRKYGSIADDPDLLMFQGDLLYTLKQFHEAAEIYRKVALKTNIGGHAWLMAGYAAWQAKDLIQSRKAFLLAADDPRQAAAAREALQQIK